MLLWIIISVEVIFQGLRVNEDHASILLMGIAASAQSPVYITLYATFNFFYVFRILIFPLGFIYRYATICGYVKYLKTFFPPNYKSFSEMPFCNWCVFNMLQGIWLNLSHCNSHSLSDAFLKYKRSFSEWCVPDVRTAMWWAVHADYLEGHFGNDQFSKCEHLVASYGCYTATSTWR